MTKDYIIAGFRIRITGGDWLPSAGYFGRALERFETATDECAECLFTLRTDRSVGKTEVPSGEIASFDLPEVGAHCRFVHTGNGRLFTIQRNLKADVNFFLPFDGSEASSDIGMGSSETDTPSLFRFGLWIVFGLAVNPHHAIPIHSSTIGNGEGAVLFLGESGTGKSTHTRLWLDHIPGSSLLNDDSPIIRMTNGIPTVYGSPWSGKAPCYKNECRSIRAFVRLSQAPRNVIRQLPVISAIGALLPSCPPAFAFDGTLQDNICDTLSEMIAHVPVYHLECLPDEAAARLSYNTIYGK